MSSSLLDWDCILPKERLGLSSTRMFNCLQGKGHPRSQNDLFPPALVGVCGPSSLSLGFQKTSSFYINLGSVYFGILYVFAVCGC